MEIDGKRVTAKQWGWSEAQVVSPLCEVHRIDVRAGGFCSWHKHDHKHNVFTVIDGLMEVEVQVGPRIVIAVLQPGMTYDVAPGLIHRFRCPTKATRAIEVYYPVSVNPNDITRFSDGGVEP